MLTIHYKTFVHWKTLNSMPPKPSSHTTPNSCSYIILLLAISQCHTSKNCHKTPNPGSYKSVSILTYPNPGKLENSQSYESKNLSIVSSPNIRALENPQSFASKILTNSKLSLVHLPRTLTIPLCT